MGPRRWRASTRTRMGRGSLSISSSCCKLGAAMAASAKWPPACLATCRSTHVPRRRRPLRCAARRRGCVPGCEQEGQVRGAQDVHAADGLPAGGRAGGPRDAQAGRPGGGEQGLVPHPGHAAGRVRLPVRRPALAPGPAALLCGLRHPGALVWHAVVVLGGRGASSLRCCKVQHKARGQPS